MSTNYLVHSVRQGKDPDFNATVLRAANSIEKTWVAGTAKRTALEAVGLALIPSNGYDTVYLIGNTTNVVGIVTMGKRGYIALAATDDDSATVADYLLKELFADFHFLNVRSLAPLPMFRDAFTLRVENGVFIYTWFSEQLKKDAIALADEMLSRDSFRQIVAENTDTNEDYLDIIAAYFGNERSKRNAH